MRIRSAAPPTSRDTLELASPNDRKFTYFFHNIAHALFPECSPSAPFALRACDRVTPQWAISPAPATSCMGHLVCLYLCYPTRPTNLPIPRTHVRPLLVDIPVSAPPIPSFQTLHSRAHVATGLYRLVLAISHGGACNAHAAQLAGTPHIPTYVLAPFCTALPLPAPAYRLCASIYVPDKSSPRHIPRHAANGPPDIDWLMLPGRHRLHAPYPCAPCPVSPSSRSPARTYPTGRSPVYYICPVGLTYLVHVSQVSRAQRELRMELFS